MNLKPPAATRRLLYQQKQPGLRFTGTYELNGDQMTLSRLAGTMMACPQEMQTEAEFLKALNRVRSWKISGQELQLFDDGGEILARLDAAAQEKAE